MSRAGHAPLYAPLRLRPGPSPRLGLFLLGIHGAALAVLYLLPLPGWAAPLLVLALLANLAWSWLLHVRRRLPGAVIEAVWDEQGLWTLALASGRRLEARLLPDSLVTLPLVILNFRHGRRGRSLVLTGDSLQPELLRQLRVRLRLEYGKAADGR